MDPITETISVTLEFSNTAFISITTTTVTTNTFQTQGTIYIPYLYNMFDPIAILASFLVFGLVGVMLKKPTTFIIAWIGFLFSGIFNQGGIYWIWVTIMMITFMVLYHLFREVTNVSEETVVKVEEV